MSNCDRELARLYGDYDPHFDMGAIIDVVPEVMGMSNHLQSRLERLGEVIPESLPHSQNNSEAGSSN